MGLRQEIINIVKEAFNIKEVDALEVPGPGETIFVKDRDGNYSQWFGVYSNSFRDDDLVPEILESVGHEEFVKGVDAGIYALPELWIWHNPKWKIGKATFVGVDVVSPGVVFAFAGGDVDPEHYGIAKAIAESDVEWRMSHTFISYTRNYELDSYKKWVTLEVTILPAGKEANPLTRFGLLSQSEETTMIDSEKRNQMKQLLNLSDEQLDGIEAQNAAIAATAVENREFKEKSEEAPIVEATEQAAEGDVEAEAKDADTEDAQVTEELNEEDAAVEEVAEVEETEVAEEAAEVVQEVAEEAARLTDDGNVLEQFADLFKAMDERLDAITAELEAVKARNDELEQAAKERNEEEKSMSPLASHAGMQALFAKYQKNAASQAALASEKDDAELLGSKPEEAETKSAIQAKFGSPLISKFMQANQQ